MTFTVHIAAPPAGLVQCCASCGFVLLDHTAWFEGHVAVPEADASSGPAWWPTGQQVGTSKTSPSDGGMTYLLNDRPLDADEQLCAGAN